MPGTSAKEDLARLTGVERRLCLRALLAVVDDTGEFVADAHCREVLRGTAESTLLAPEPLLLKVGAVQDWGGRLGASCTHGLTIKTTERRAACANKTLFLGVRATDKARRPRRQSCLVMKAIAKFDIDFPRIVPVKTSEGHAVVKLCTSIRNIDPCQRN